PVRAFPLQEILIEDHRHLCAVRSAQPQEWVHQKIQKDDRLVSDQRGAGRQPAQPPGPMSETSSEQMSWASQPDEYRKCHPHESWSLLHQESPENTLQPYHQSLPAPVQPTS